MEASPGQLKEYEKQLADVIALLQDSPEDESLLSLKSDLEELVALTKDTLAGGDKISDGSEDASNDNQGAASSGITSASTAADQASLADSNAVPLPPPPSDWDARETGEETKQVALPQSAADPSEPPKKKAKKMKEFEVPQRLLPLDTDSEAEKKRKKRAIKALKGNWKEKKKEVETEMKKQSWQSFQKKKKVKKEGSIFSTHDGDAKVGVVAARKKTDFGERQRYKH